MVYLPMGHPPKHILLRDTFPLNNFQWGTHSWDILLWDALLWDALLWNSQPQPTSRMATVVFHVYFA